MKSKKRVRIVNREVVEIRELLQELGVAPFEEVELGENEYMFQRCLSVRGVSVYVRVMVQNNFCCKIYVFPFLRRKKGKEQQLSRKILELNHYRYFGGFKIYPDNGDVLYEYAFRFLPQHWKGNCIKNLKLFSKKIRGNYVIDRDEFIFLFHNICGAVTNEYHTLCRYCEEYD